MSVISNSVETILAGAQTSGEALKQLFNHYKALQPRFSMTTICKKSGVKSRGQLSDVFSGRRLLPSRYLAGIQTAFSLGPLQAECLKLLIERDQAKTKEERSSIELALMTARKTLEIRYESFRFGAKQVQDAMEVYCALGLKPKPNDPSAIQRALGGAQTLNSVQDGLALLVSIGAIQIDPDLGYVIESQHLLFGLIDGKERSIDYLKGSISHALSCLEEKFNERSSSFFTSTILSVKRRDYETALAELRAKVVAFQSELESGEADTLVRLNIQIYTT